MTQRRSARHDPERIAFAREQRQQSNEFAQNVWQMVRGSRMQGQKFRREHPVGPYTLDFVCLDLKLNIEIDGEDHLTAEGRQHDQLRDAYLQRLGFAVLRIPGFRVTQDPIGVRNAIEETVRRLQAITLASDSPSPPAPLPEAGRGE